MKKGIVLLAVFLLLIAGVGAIWIFWDEASGNSPWEPSEGEPTYNLIGSIDFIGNLATIKYDKGSFDYYTKEKSIFSTLSLPHQILSITAHEYVESKILLCRNGICIENVQREKGVSRFVGFSTIRHEFTFTDLPSGSYLMKFILTSNQGDTSQDEFEMVVEVPHEGWDSDGGWS